MDEKIRRYHENGVPLVVVDAKLSRTLLCGVGEERVNVDRLLVPIAPAMLDFVLDVSAIILASRAQ